nr:tubby-like F-box protein 5 [Tanacetum cinerariifolium]
MLAKAHVKCARAMWIDHISHIIETALAGDLSKLLLAAKVRKVTGTEFLISLAADDFSRATNTYAGILRAMNQNVLSSMEG